jgi:hypothetical protein
MIAEPLFECPNCKAKMELIVDGPSNVRVFLFCSEERSAKKGGRA